MNWNIPSSSFFSFHFIHEASSLLFSLIPVHSSRSCEAQSTSSWVVPAIFIIINTKGAMCCNSNHQAYMEELSRSFLSRFDFVLASAVVDVEHCLDLLSDFDARPRPHNDNSCSFSPIAHHRYYHIFTLGPIIRYHSDGESADALHGLWPLSFWQTSILLGKSSRPENRQCR